MHHQQTRSRKVDTRVGTLTVFPREGAGTPILLWPSLFTDHRMYDRLVGRMDESWQPIAVDGPGFGASDPPLPRTQPDQYAMAVVDLLDQLDIERAGYLGTSWGGQIGVHVTGADPRIAFVALANTPITPSSGGSLLRLAMSATIGPSRFYGRGAARVMLSRSSSAIEDELVAMFETFRRKPMTRTANTTLRHFPGVVPQIQKMTTPTTLVIGADDRLYPPQMFARALRGIPSAVTIVELPECGHLAPMEAPDLVLLELERLRARSAA